MSTRRKFTKYLALIAIIAISTLIWGCSANIAPVDAVAVTSITITGAEGGIPIDQTLQMSASVLPTGATDKSVTWSVANGTGTATISVTGLLEATGLGTVTVTATAKDGSAITGSLEITVKDRIAMTLATIPGIVIPIIEETPVTLAIETTQYTGTVAWDPTVSQYAALTVYTATITLTPKTGFTLEGVAANFFTVVGAVATNDANIGVVTAVFPKTAANPSTKISGVIPPALGATPVTVITKTAQYSGSVTWSPADDPFAASTEYTATITLTAETGSLADITENSFTVIGATTTNSVASGVVTAAFPVTAAAPLETVNLRSAGNYVILAEAAISTTGTTHITGDIGLSPAAASYFTGFDLTKATGYATSALITGNMYAADMADPTPSNLTVAVVNMIAAYNDAAGRPNPNYLNLGTGAIGGLTLSPGLYKWNSSITIGEDLTLNGSADDVWIFQISNDLNLSSNVKINLTGGATYDNVFWQVAEIAKLETGAHMEGIILSQTQINLKTGSTINGRLLAQSQVTLDAVTVVAP